MIEEEYENLCSLFGIGRGLWQQMHEKPSMYVFCPANQKSYIAEYLLLEQFVESAKKYGITYYYGIDVFLENFKDVVYNRIKIDSE